MTEQPQVSLVRTLDLLAEARVAVVTLPTVNLYLQDRGGGRTPRWRGVTLVHEGCTAATPGPWIATVMSPCAGGLPS